MDNKEVNLTVSTNKSVLSLGLNGLKDFKLIALPNDLIFVGITKDVNDILEERLSNPDSIKEGYIEFLNGDKLHHKNVEIIGHKKELMPFIKSYIPVAKFHINSEFVGYGNTKYRMTNETPEYFCCYSNPNKRNQFHNIIIHEDAKSSFNCICEFLKTDYVIIINNK